MPPEVDLRRPVLDLLTDGRTRGIADVTKLMADKFGLDEEERVARHAVSQRPKFGMRVRHAVSHLRIAGYLSNDALGSFAITQAGRGALSLGQGRLDDKFLLANSPEYRGHRDALAARQGALSRAGAPAEKEGLVAMLDMLGVKGLDGGEDQARVHRGWRDLLSAAKALLECSEALRGRYTISAFSDTMLITASGGAGADAEGMLLGFSDVAWRLVVMSIVGGVPVRGCVSHGRYFQGARSLFTGRAVDEAARYHALPQWIGVSAAPSANSILNGIIRRRSDPRNRFYTKYDIPLKSSVEQDAWVVNWPRQCDEEEQGEAVESMLVRIDEKLGGITDVDAALKWRNTRKFCTDMLAA